MNTSGDGHTEGEPKKPRSDLPSRILSALVMVPVVLGATWYGGAAFAILAALGSVIVFSEWTGLTGPGMGPILSRIFAVVLAVSVLAVQFWTPMHGALLLALTVAFALGFSITNGGSMWPAAGIGYAGLAGVGLVSLRLGDAGLAAVLFVFAIVWGNDIAAYFVGRAAGGPKLWPAVSPKKTWSGALGGLCFGVAAGLAVAAAFGVVPGIALAIVAVVISIAGQAGDLLESSIKRRAGKKDSGTLIPGHGGLMDRVDALILAVGVAVTIGWIRAGFAEPARGMLEW